MFRIALFLFVTIPLAELYLLIRVGSGIGGITTIALCLLTALLGGLLIRWQGMTTLLDAQRSLQRGHFPAEHGLHGIMLAVAGIMLFLPGFITDMAGFLLLVPAIRSWLINRFSMLPNNDSGIIDAEVIITPKSIDFPDKR